MRFLREGQTLNKVEQIKLQRHPLEVKQAIIDTYSEDLSRMDEVPGEVERLKWVGIYPQKQGGDAFMMRVKVPGGVLTPEQTKVIGKIASDFANGPISNPHFGNNFLDITTRQDVQMHWLKMGDIPEVWRRLEEAGITTVQACGDSARNVLCCPVSGLDHEEVIDAYPIAQAISDYFTGNREYANLPRKFKMSVTGCLEDCAQAEINDIGLLPARLEDGTIGFNLRVGGGLSDGPRMASDIDVFVRPEEAVEITRGIAQVFGELGDRENRWTARMRYLVQRIGPEAFRDELEKRVSVELTPAGEDLTKRYRGDHVGVHAQKDGLFYVGLNVPVGRMSGEHFVEAGRLAEEYGGEVRLATDQNLVITGVPEDKIDDLLAEPLLERFSPKPGAFERGVVACTGSEFCRFGIVETKIRAVEWAKEMDERVGDVGQDAVRMHFSGCSASCAQPQIGDVGFRGETAKTQTSIVEGVDIGLGGSLGRDAAFIDWVEGAKPAEEVPDALVSVFERFKEEGRPGERFHEWARRKKNKELREALRKPAKVGGR
ncbi:ferredoxin--nitrite reductase [Rubrobacter tropicus]|uniref:assimilatory sulfite reductase (ferredoxin) n=1 Tax=Rubrobacter tropicus TaxID=2653851 RepID=A0A6G8Q7I6_9ACTN|nr:ferredoxin--nitrite reductase [Rubrobacter tropicus]QIN82436.1 ferredoxin--nitrite reductase [Rubrobacter tropicus]